MSVQLSEAEAEALRRAAYARGISLSDEIRRLAKLRELPDGRAGNGRKPKAACDQ